MGKPTMVQSGDTTPPANCKSTSKNIANNKETKTTKKGKEQQEDKIVIKQVKISQDSFTNKKVKTLAADHFSASVDHISSNSSALTTVKVSVNTVTVCFLLHTNLLPVHCKNKNSIETVPEAVASSSSAPKQALFVDKVPELLSISSISAETFVPTPGPNHASIIQCNEQWKSMKLDAKAQQQQSQKKIDCFVKEHLFRKVKFFNIEMMCYSTNINSICQMVCKALNIVEADKETF